MVHSLHLAINSPLSNQKPAMSQTFLFHDYETWGVDPRRDRPVQFAAIRTDANFNPIGRPIELFAQLAPDYLPAPEACLVTGITPQIAQQKGLPECEFMRKIQQHMSEPGTCSLGYNTIRFDDEVTRHSLYRNLLEPYGREWQNGNSRWDLIDLVRATYALRPEGIEWPTNDEGNVSFKLELLTQANGLAHENAHDALSDVHATIAMAKLIKDKQPKLYQYFFDNRGKQAIEAMVNDAMTHPQGPQPLMHISGRISPAQGCCAWVMPVLQDSRQKTKFLMINLTMDITPLLELDAVTIKQRMYTPRQQLQEQGLLPIPLKWVQSNKCPVIAPAKTLRPEDAERIGIDRNACLQRLKQLQQHWHPLLAKLTEWLELEHQGADERPPTDADIALYDGFISNPDKQQMDWLHQQQPEQLAGLDTLFDDPRLNTLLFRYKARNYPSSLSDTEQQQWLQFCRQRIFEPDSDWLTLEQMMARIQSLSETHADDSRAIRILKQCYDYAVQTYG
ncbi:exodeoxyribonuclease I [Neiella marina]|uniref:Exodeoxyribonuclease I n=2 Tax=Neiella marina TaxID=508461 RepID=A0A8J2U312_9GAMM|nr:exodeoxyribonuclease I [Neiella marina]